MNNFWAGKRVLVTGHTGFKGSWLFYWLRLLGAEAYGYSLAPTSERSLFAQLKLQSIHDQDIGDILDVEKLRARVADVQPQVIFHLAAQPLVRHSYQEPGLTWQTNVIGTINLMEAVRHLTEPVSLVVVTTDKVYENKEWEYAYREVDNLGGHDPYSSSKAGCELAVSSWRNSFFTGSNIRVATARAGNVIGGGDWAEDRIIPDLVRAVEGGTPLVVRNSSSVRPWQHVLDPLGGYLELARRLFESDDPQFQAAFNFGPTEQSVRTVADLVRTGLEVMPGKWEEEAGESSLHEAKLLSLTIQKARQILGWSPRWDFDKSVCMTMEWYKGYYQGVQALDLVSNQIVEYAKS